MHTGLIVGHIEHPVTTAQLLDLKPSWPVNSLDAPLDSWRSDPLFPVRDHLEPFDGDQQVVHLVCPDEWRVDFHFTPAFRPDANRVAVQTRRQVDRRHDHEVSADGNCALLQHSQYIRSCFAGHERDARLDDPRFFSRDRFERISQVFRVIECDVRDDRQLGCNHVGGIEPATQSHFDDGDVDIGGGQRLKRDHGGCFEKRGA